MNLQILTRGFSLRKIREKNISSDVNLDKNSTKHLRRNHSAIFTLQIKIRSLYLNRAQSGYAPCWLHMNWQLRLTVPAQLYSIWPWEVLIHSCYSKRFHLGFSRGLIFFVTGNERMVKCNQVLSFEMFSFNSTSSDFHFFRGTSVPLNSVQTVHECQILLL